jgi:hypothetical protein
MRGKGGEASKAEVRGRRHSHGAGTRYHDPPPVEAHPPQTTWCECGAIIAQGATCSNPACSATYLAESGLHVAGSARPWYVHRLDGYKRVDDMRKAEVAFARQTALFAQQTSEQWKLYAMHLQTLLYGTAPAPGGTSAPAAGPSALQTAGNDAAGQGGEAGVRDGGIAGAAQHAAATTSDEVAKLASGEPAARERERAAVAGAEIAEARVRDAEARLQQTEALASQAETRVKQAETELKKAETQLREAAAALQALQAEHEELTRATALFKDDARVAHDETCAAIAETRAAVADAAKAKAETSAARAEATTARAETCAANAEVAKAKAEASAARAEAKSAQDRAVAVKANAAAECKKAQTAAAAAKKAEADAVAERARATAFMAAAHKAGAKAKAECAESVAAAMAAKKAELEAKANSEKARALASSASAAPDSTAAAQASASVQDKGPAPTFAEAGAAGVARDSDPARPMPKNKKKNKKKGRAAGKSKDQPAGTMDDKDDEQPKDDLAQLLREARVTILKHEKTIQTLLQRAGGRRSGWLQQMVSAAVREALGPSFTKTLREDAAAAARRAEVTTTRLELLLADNQELCTIVRDLTSTCTGTTQEAAEAAETNLERSEKFRVASILALLDGALGGQSHWFETTSETLADVATATAQRVRTLHDMLKGASQEFLAAFALFDPSFADVALSVQAVVSDGTIRDTVQWLTVAFKLFRTACARDVDGKARPNTPILNPLPPAELTRVRALAAELTSACAALDASAVEVEKLRAAYTTVVTQLRALQTTSRDVSFSDRRALGIKYRCAKPDASAAHFTIARVVSFCVSALRRVSLDATSIFGTRAENFAFGAGTEAHVNFLFDKVQITLATLVRTAQGHASVRDKLEREIADLTARASDFEEVRDCVLAMYDAAGYPLTKTAGTKFDAAKARAHFDKVTAQANVCTQLQERLRNVLQQHKQSEEKRRQANQELDRLRLLLAPPKASHEVLD